MNRKEENLESIPTALINEILSRLPAKSIARFRCVSKQWGSILGGPYFIELSRARPRILFACRTQEGEWSLFWSPQPHNPYQKSSLVVAADLHMDFSPWFSCNGYPSGLIYFSGMHGICNPSTGQYAILPKLTMFRKSYELLGFDSIGNQYKLLSMDYYRSDHQILTLRTGTMRWRNIQCPLPHRLWSGGICINGVLYYLASDMIVCFDVRSEKFEFILLPHSFNYQSKVVNYKGKLGVISCKDDDASNVIELCMLVLADAEEHEFSKYVYTLPKNELFDHRNVSVAGVTTNGEIVLSMDYASKLFYVFYFDPERNTLQSVEIQGFGAVERFGRVYAFLDHVEDLNFNIMNATSISPPEQKHKLMSTSSKEDHQKQDHRTFESNNKGAISISPPDQKRRPTSTSTSSKQAHHQQQDRHTF